MNNQNIDTHKGKLHKLEIYVADPNTGYEDAMDIFYEIERKLYEGMPVIFDHKTVDVDWYDEIDINMRDATREDYEKYFE